MTACSVRRAPTASGRPAGAGSSTRSTGPSTSPRACPAGPARSGSSRVRRCSSARSTTPARTPSGSVGRGPERPQRHTAAGPARPRAGGDQPGDLPPPDPVLRTGTRRAVRRTRAVQCDAADVRVRGLELVRVAGGARAVRPPQRAAMGLAARCSHRPRRRWAHGLVTHRGTPGISPGAAEPPQTPGPRSPAPEPQAQNRRSSAPDGPGDPGVGGTDKVEEGEQVVPGRGALGTRVARTVSTSRAKASSTCPPTRSRSAAWICAATSSGRSAAVARTARASGCGCAGGAAPGRARPAIPRRPGSSPERSRRSPPRSRGRPPRSRHRPPRCAPGRRLLLVGRLGVSSGAIRPVMPFWTAIVGSCSTTLSSSASGSAPGKAGSAGLEQRNRHRYPLDGEGLPQPGLVSISTETTLEPAARATRGRRDGVDLLDGLGKTPGPEHDDHGQPQAR